MIARHQAAASNHRRWGGSPGYLFADHNGHRKGYFESWYGAAQPLTHLPEQFPRDFDPPGSHRARRVAADHLVGLVKRLRERRVGVGIDRCLERFWLALRERAQSVGRRLTQGRAQGSERLGLGGRQAAGQGFEGSDRHLWEGHRRRLVRVGVLWLARMARCGVPTRFAL